MEGLLVITSILMNLATILSVILLLRSEQRKKRKWEEEKHKELVQTIVSQKEQEYERERQLEARFGQIREVYDCEIEEIKMSVEDHKKEQAVEIEKLKSSIEKLHLMVDNLSRDISKIGEDISKIQGFVREVYEFMGYTKGETNARKRTTKSANK